MASVSRGEVRDIYITAELGGYRSFYDFPKPCRYLIEGLIPEDCPDVLEVIMEWPPENRDQIMHSLSRDYRHNEVYDYLYSCVRWERTSVPINRITTGGIVGLEHIKYNNRHRIIDLANELELPLSFDGNVEEIPFFVFIAVEDNTPVEDDDVSQNVRLIDGAHRVIQIAKAGWAEFDVCVGYME